MAYTDATADDLKTAYPRFAAVEDETVEFWLERARRGVDESWTEGDYAMGQMLLAAHHMTLNGLGTGVEATVAAQGMGDFKSVRSGSFSLDRGEAGSAAAAGTLGSTSYGRQFAALAKLNVGGPRVMATGTIPTSPLYPRGA
jgi:hypothetical protein